MSPAFEALTRMCGTCGKPPACPLHDSAYLEALLAPPEEPYPWDRMERRDLGNYGNDIWALSPLGDGTILVGGVGGAIAHYAIPPDVLRRYHERKIQPPPIPPMPEA